MSIYGGGPTHDDLMRAIRTWWDADIDPIEARARAGDDAVMLIAAQPNAVLRGAWTAWVTELLDLDLVRFTELVQCERRGFWAQPGVDQLYPEAPA